MSNRSIFLSTSFAMALLGASGQAWAETVVLRASGPSAANFTQGQRLADAAQIRLIEGDSLSLLSSGSTVQLQGPYNGSVRGSESVEPRSFNWHTMLKAPRRSRAGGSRGPTVQTLASN